METQYKRIVYYKDENSSLEYEMFDGHAYLHSTINNWNLSVFKNCLRVLNSLFHDLKEQGITHAMAITPNPKFSHLFGGKTLFTIEHLEKEYEVVIWDFS